MTTPLGYLVPGHGLRVRSTLCHHIEGQCAPFSQATLAAQAAAAAAAAARAQVEALAALQRAQQRVDRAVDSARALASARAARTDSSVTANRLRRALAGKKAGGSYVSPLVVDGQVVNVKRLD